MTMILVMMMTMVITISAKSNSRPPHRSTNNHHAGYVVKHRVDKHKAPGRCVCYKKLNNKHYKSAKAWRKAMDKHMKKCECRCHHIGRPIHFRGN